MFAVLAMVSLVAGPADLPSPDSGLVHRVQAQTVGGNGGVGGSTPVIITGGTIYLTPQGGAGGNGGNAVGAAPPPPVGPPRGRSVVTSSVISKCTLKIAGKTVVDATGCNFDSSDSLMQVRAPSDTTDYTMKVVYNPDKSGQGFLSSGKTPAERGLGTMTRHGACWLNTDGSVEICAWK
jgi:hypothetical protein